jgi:hypothetical protein
MDIFQCNDILDCPKTSDFGQPNLPKPALENQSFALSGMAGFLGKGIRSCILGMAVSVFAGSKIESGIPA